MRLVVGRVVRGHGLRGDVVVDPRTDTPGERFAVGNAFDTGTGTLTVTRAQDHGGRLLVRFAEASDRDAADALRGTVLYVESDEVARSDGPDDFHDTELIGMAVLDTAGGSIGTVVDVVHPAQDLLVIERREGGEVMVPFVRALVPTVDLAAGRMVIDPPPGLLDAE